MVNLVYLAHSRDGLLWIFLGVQWAVPTAVFLEGSESKCVFPMWCLGSPNIANFQC